MFDIDVIIQIRIALHLLVLGWLIKTTINFAILCFVERKLVDVAIALLFLGLAIDRVSILWVNTMTLSQVGRIHLNADEVYGPFLGQIVVLALTCLLFLVFDLVFFRHKPDENSPQT